MSSLQEISSRLLAFPITGVNLRSKTLGEELGNARLFLVFLRHLG